MMEGGKLTHLIVTCGCGQKMKVPQGMMGHKGRCAGCGEVVAVSVANAVAVDGDDEAPRTAPAQDAKACASCRRPFKGDWDRMATPEGVLCHICGHQAYRIEKPEGPEPRPVPLKIRQHKAEGDNSRKRPNPKELAIFGSVFAVSMAAVLFLPINDWIQAIFSGAPVDEEAEIRGFWAYVYYSYRFLIGYAGEFVPLYLILKWTERRVIATAKWHPLEVVVPAFWLLLASYVAMFIIFGVVLLFVFRIWFVMDRFNLAWEEVVVYLISSVIFAFIVMASSVFVYGVIGRMAL